MLLGTNCQPFFVAYVAPQGHLVVRRAGRKCPTQLPSAAQRYNTLDFGSKVVCQQGMLLAPIGNPEPKRGYPSLKSPRPFCIPDQASNTQSPQHRSMYFPVLFCAGTKSRLPISPPIPIRAQKCGVVAEVKLNKTRTHPRRQERGSPGFSVLRTE